MWMMVMVVQQNEVLNITEYSLDVNFYATYFTIIKNIFFKKS